MQRNHSSLAVTDQQMAERMGVLIDRSSKAAEVARGRYERLLRTYPQGSHLGKIYARFCVDVLNDSSLGQLYDSGDGNAGAGSVSGGSVSERSRASSALGGGGTSQSGGRISQRQHVPKPRTSEVERMSMRFKIGMLVLLLLTAGMFFTSRTILQLIDDDIDLVTQAGRLTWAASSSALHARAMSLRHTEATAQNTVADMQEWKNMAQTVFEATRGRSEQNARWFTSDLTLRTYQSGGTWYTESWNLWDASNVMVADMNDILGLSANGSLPLTFHDNVDWRFVMDNLVTVVVPALSQLGDMVETQVFAQDEDCTCLGCHIVCACCSCCCRREFNPVLTGALTLLLCVIVSCVCFCVFCVFVPALFVGARVCVCMCVCVCE